MATLAQLSKYSPMGRGIKKAKNYDEFSGLGNFGLPAAGGAYSGMPNPPGGYAQPPGSGDAAAGVGSGVLGGSSGDGNAPFDYAQFNYAPAPGGVMNQPGFNPSGYGEHESMNKVAYPSPANPAGVMSKPGFNPSGYGESESMNKAAYPPGTGGVKSPYGPSGPPGFAGAPQEGQAFNFDQLGQFGSQKSGLGANDPGYQAWLQNHPGTSWNTYNSPGIQGLIKNKAENQAMVQANKQAAEDKFQKQQWDSLSPAAQQMKTKMNAYSAANGPDMFKITGNDGPGGGEIIDTMFGKVKGSAFSKGTWQWTLQNALGSGHFSDPQQIVDHMANNGFTWNGSTWVEGPKANSAIEGNLYNNPYSAPEWAGSPGPGSGSGRR